MGAQPKADSRSRRPQAESHGWRRKPRVKIGLLRVADKALKLADSAQIDRRTTHDRPASGIALLTGNVGVLQVVALIQPALYPKVEAFEKLVPGAQGLAKLVAVPASVRKSAPGELAEVLVAVACGADGSLIE